MPVPDSWVLGSAYIIRQAGTNKYFPLRKGGNTQIDPIELNSNELSHWARWPRLFRNERQAKNFLSQWRRGRHVALGEGEIDVRPVPGRDQVQFEIIPLKLVIEPT